MNVRMWLLTLGILIGCLPLRADDWPAFRGPQGTGISQEDSAPAEWGPDQNIKWKVALPRPGNGSPIVSRGRVFVTSAEDADGKQRSLYCFDRDSGRQLWVRTVSYPEKMDTHQTNPYGGSTPAADGQRVVVWHGSAGLYCYDLDGNPLWSRDLGQFKHMWGYGTSPVLYGDRVIMHCGPGERVFMAALDAQSGKTLWQTDEPQEGDGSHRNDGNPMGSWCTPVVVQVDGRDQLVCTMPKRIVAYDPDNGKVLWSCQGVPHDRGDLAYSSPVIADDICVVIGGYKGPGIGVKLGGEGDVTEKLRLWRHEKNPQSIGSGVFIDGYVYRPNDDPKSLECLDPKTGEIKWFARAGSFWGSIVYVAGRCYCTNQDGVTVVFKPSPDSFELVSKNELGSPSNSTPAVSNGELFIRTADWLFCVAGEPGA